MAQKIQTLLIEDLDDSEAEGAVRFQLDGTEYEIDLNVASVRGIWRNPAYAGLGAASCLVPAGTGRCLPQAVSSPARSGHTPWPGCMAG